LGYINVNMKGKKLARESLTCMVRREHLGINHQGKMYCKLYYPTVQTADFECPLLDKTLIRVRKGEGIMSREYYSWCCSRAEYKGKDITTFFKQIKNDYKL